MGLKLPLIKYIQLQRVGVVLNWDITLQRKKPQTPPLKNKHMEKVWRYQKGYWETVNRIMTQIIQQTKQTNNGHQNTKQETTLL
jgi:hypothetical protein